RIVQESLTNVVKHAQAQRVSILLTRTNGTVKAVVEDDGKGFDPEKTASGFGLVGMRERLALLGGRLEVESTGGARTTGGGQGAGLKRGARSWANNRAGPPASRGSSNPRQTRRAY